ncbi:ChaN family lipoprotein [Vibrio gallicus]|uniref:ChaN family lipoprotein n=1 Tax=Vibrio gallicus TaxID=190897 RepID=UPI0021C2C29E|nr:ChaN family lipoprotein [Vibrio gallicus]
MKKRILTILSWSCCSISVAKPVTYFEYQLFSPAGTPVELSTVVDASAQSNTILVGEWHSHSAVHRFQSDIYQALLAHYPNTDLSMEQFSRPAQNTLNQYLNGEIGERALIAHAKAWPNYTSDYRALVEQAKSAKRAIIAANAPREIVRCIGQKGVSYLETLPPIDRSHVAQQLDTSDRAYKRQFFTAMQGMPQSRLENFYAAQVAWDETMAESIARHLKANSNSRVMHIAGKFHIDNGDGIAYALKARAPRSRIIIITPVTKVSDRSNAPFPEYQLLVLPLPVQTMSGVSDNATYSHTGTHAQQQCD